VYPNSDGSLKIRIFKTKNFVRWARKEKITDDLLRAAVNELSEGLIDADLGGGLVKPRKSSWITISGATS